MLSQIAPIIGKSIVSKEVIVRRYKRGNWSQKIVR
jgi:hypothetical protein